MYICCSLAFKQLGPQTRINKTNISAIKSPRKTSYKWMAIKILSGSPQRVESMKKLHFYSLSVPSIPCQPVSQQRRKFKEEWNIFICLKYSTLFYFCVCFLFSFCLDLFLSFHTSKNIFVTISLPLAFFITHPVSLIGFINE